MLTAKSKISLLDSKMLSEAVELLNNSGWKKDKKYQPIMLCQYKLHKMTKELSNLQWFSPNIVIYQRKEDNI